MAPTLNYRDPGTGDFIALGGDALPIGTIMGFGGSVAPTGWHICDGTAHGSAELQALFGSANTPDLRDKFIIGASATRPSKTTGGLASVTLTSAQSGRSVHTHPSANTKNNDLGHTHSVSFNPQGAHNHSSGSTTTGYATNAMRSTVLQETNVDYPIISADANGDWAASKAETNKGAHTHTGTTGAHSKTHTHTATVANSAAANATTSHENRPPYYAMVFIVKAA